MSNHWEDWLSQVDHGQLPQLIAALQKAGAITAPGSNGVKPLGGYNQFPATYPNSEAQATTILSTPLEDFMYDSCPPYVDIHGLTGIYNKLAFRNNLLVKGPKGDGKTLSFIHWCHSTKTPLVVAECSQDTKKRDLVGTIPNLGQFQLGPIPQVIDIANTYGRAVIIFEEINALTPQIQKVLNGLLDFRRFITIPQIGKTYRLKEGAKLWCVAAMNPSVYGGTYDLNEDLRSRWIELEVGYPKHGQEKDIIKAHFPTMKPELEEVVDKCIRFAADTRQQSTGYALSTRDLVDIVGLLEVMSLQEALQLTVCKFEGDDRETIIKRVSSSFANIKPKEHWGK